MSKPTFPRDSTGAQWFDHDQFNAYHALGRFIGGEAKRAKGNRWPSTPAPLPDFQGP